MVSGVICAPMSGERCVKLELPAMIQNNQDPHLTAFTVSCDAIGKL
jgi:3,4-dihydroxy 2-butanone 4-phosphate synthase / GTP cyclohydrolase II